MKSREGPIEVRWSNRKLEEACSSEPIGRRRYGAAEFRKLQVRLAALAAAPSLETMRSLPGRCHQLVGDRRGEFAIDLWGQYRLVFLADHDPVPRDETGTIVWAAITRIVIMEIVDYHER